MTRHGFKKFQKRLFSGFGGLVGEWAVKVVLSHVSALSWAAVVAVGLLV